MTDCTKDELKRYFHLIYRSTEDFEIVEDGSPLFHKWNPTDGSDAAAGLEAAAAALTLTEEEKAKEEKAKKKALKKAARKAKADKSEDSDSSDE
jgi:acetyl-CoA acetyltransferase